MKRQRWILIVDRRRDLPRLFEAVDSAIDPFDVRYRTENANSFEHLRFNFDGGLRYDLVFVNLFPTPDDACTDFGSSVLIYLSEFLPPERIVVVGGEASAVKERLAGWYGTHFTEIPPPDILKKCIEDIFDP